MLELIDVVKNYKHKKKNSVSTVFRAVDHINLSFDSDRIYCLVGESGSGKSTTARLMVGLEKPDGGKVCFLGRDIHEMKRREARNMRMNLQIIFQDSHSSLDPRWRVYDSIAEPLRNFESLTYKQEKKRIAHLLDLVGLCEDDGGKYPHQFSGGQQKRICIARAISINSRFIVFDEAVSGLDRTIRKKILLLLHEIRHEIKSTFLFITHDIEVAMFMSRNIIVMREGKIVEKNYNVNSFDDFKHPYSRELIDSLL